MSSLIQNWENAEAATKAAEEAEGTSLAENEVYMDSIDGRISKLQARLQELAVDFVSSDFMKGLVDLGTTAITFLDSIIDKLGTIPTLITTITTVISAKNFAEGKGNLFANIFRGIKNKEYNNENYSFAQDILEQAHSGTDFKSAIENAQKENYKLSASMKELISSYEQGSLNIKDFRHALNDIPKSASPAVNAFKSIGSSIKNIGANVLSSLATGAVFGLVSMAISGIVSLIDKAVNKAKYAKQEMEDTFSSYESDNSEYESIVSELETQRAEYDKLISKGDDLTTAEQNRLKELKESTAELESQAYWADQIRNGSAAEAAEKAAKAFKTEFGYSYQRSYDDLYDAWMVEKTKNPDLDLQAFSAQYWNGEVDSPDTKPGQLEEVTKLIAAEEKLQEIKENYRDYEDNTEYKAQKETVDELRSSLLQTSGTLGEYIEKWDALPDEYREAYQTYYDAAIVFQNQIQQALDPEGFRNNQFKDIIDSYSDTFEIDLKTIASATADKNLENYQESVEKVASDLEKLKKLGVDASQTVFGNINVDDRNKITWGKFDGIEIAFSPVLQTEDGSESLDTDEVNSYIEKLIEKAKKKYGTKWSSHLIDLDADGLEIDGKKINNLLADVGKTAKSTAKAMKYLGKNGWLNVDKKQMEKLEQIYKNGEVSVDTLENAFPDLIKRVHEAGYTTEQFTQYLRDNVFAQANASSEAEELAKSYSEISENVATVLSSITTLTEYLNSTSLSSSFSMEDFDSDSFKELLSVSSNNGDWSEYGEYIEMVNGVLTLNTDLVKKNTQALAEQKIEEAVDSKKNLQSEYTQNLRLIQKYTDAIKKNGYATVDGITITQSSIDALIQQNATISKQCDGLDLYIANIKEATGAYQAWVDAQSQSDSGEMFDQSVTAVQKIKNVYDETSDDYLKVGKGAKQYNAAFDYIIGEEIANRNGINSEDVDSVKAYMDTIDYLFSKDDDGNIDGFDYVGFIDQAVSQGLMKFNESGDAEINGEMTMRQFAEGMNLSLPLVQSIFAELSEYPNDFSWKDEDYTQLFTDISQAYAKLQEDTSAGDASAIDEDTTALEKYAKQIASLDKETRHEMGIDVEDGDWQGVIDQVNKYYNSLSEVEQKALEAGIAIADLKTAAQTSQSTLAELDEKYVTDGVTTETVANINLDTDNYNQVFDDMGTIKTYINEINNSDLTPEVKTAEISKANDMLAYMQERIIQVARIGKLDINMSEEEISSEIESIVSELDVLKSSDGLIHLDTDGASEVYNELQMLIAAKYSFNQPAVMSLDVSGAESEVGQAIQKVQEFQSAVNDLNYLKEMQNLGFDIDNSSIDEAKTKVDNLKVEIAGLSSETQAKVGLDVTTSTTAEELQSQIGEINIDTVAKLIPDEVTNYEPSDEEFNVTAKLNKKAIDDFKASVEAGNYNTESTHTIHVNTQSLTLNPTGTKTSGASSANGTAHAKGNWGTKKTETALVGELGTELAVNPYTGVWETIGENGAEFRKIPAGSIIFNHKQTEELFKNGYITSRGKQIKGASWATGTALVSGGTSVYSKKKIQKANKASSEDSDSDSASEAASYASDAAESSSEAASSAAEAAEEFSEMIDWIEVKINRIERIIDNFATVSDSEFNTYNKRAAATSSQIAKTFEEIAIQQQAYDRYLQQANSVGLSEDYAAKVRDGLIDIEEITDETLKNNIDDYQEWYEKAIDCSDKIVELRENVRELYQTKFENISDEFEKIIDDLNSQNSLIEAQISLIEERGHLVDESYYKSIVDIQNRLIPKYQDEINKLQSAMDDAVRNGTIEKYSSSWYDMKATIDEVKQSIVEAQQAITEANNNIRQLKWDAFDKLQESLSDINNESEFLLDLLDAYDLVDEKTGNITTNGIASLGLYAAEYSNYMQQAVKYAEEMSQIDKDLSNDPSNQDLLERRQELLEAQRDSIQSAEKQKDAIKDLIEEGIQGQLDALQDLIDKYGDMLDAEKDAYEYQQDIAEKSKNISDLQKQINAYSGDNSEENMLRVQKLKNDLEDAQKELQETQYDKYIDETKSMLDELYSDYETLLNNRLDDIDALVQDVINSLKSGTTDIIATIKNESKDVGYNISDALINVINNFGSIPNIKNYNLRGYASGTRGVKKSGLYWTNENASETIVRKSDGAILTKLNTGDMVIPHGASNNFWSMMANPNDFFKNIGLQETGINNLSNAFNCESTVNLSISLPNVKNYEQFKSALKNDDNFERYIQEVTFGQFAGHGKLNKYRI